MFSHIILTHYKSGPSLKHLLYIAETEGPAADIVDYRSWSSSIDTATITTATTTVTNKPIECRTPSTATITILVSDDPDLLDPSELVTTVHQIDDDDDDDDVVDDDENVMLRRATSSLFQMHSFATTANVAASSTSSSSSSVSPLNSKVCTVCNKSFSRAWSLQRHMTDRHFYVPQHLECEICGRTYRSRNSLISHKSQYHGAGVSSKVKDHPNKWSCTN